PELVLTDVDGRMKIYNAVTMAELGSVSVEEGALTPPIFGDFNGDNQLEIAVGTQSGRLIVLDGSTLDVIWNVEAGSSFSLQPTLVPVEQADGKRRDVIVLLEQ